MGEGLRRRILQDSFESPIQEAVLNVIVAAGHLREQIDRSCQMQGITQAQYNLLRILRGAGPEGHPRGEIIRRMLDRAPDATRLIARLEARGLVEKVRSPVDRRLSVTRITPAGLVLVEALKPVVDEMLARLSRRLTPEECVELSRLCELIYAEDEKPTDTERTGE